MDTIARDLALAGRFLRQRPLFTLVSALSIAIGVGATTAMLGVTRVVLLQAPPGIADADRVLDIGRTQGGRGHDTFSYAELRDFRAGAVPPLASVSGVAMQLVSWSTGDTSEQLLGAAVSGDYFATMGVHPAAGRFFLQGEDAVPGGAAVAIVSWRFWQDRLGGAPDAIGRTLDINRTAFTVIGIAPRAFQGHVIGAAPDVWVPLTMFGVLQPGFAAWDEPRSSWLTVVGRLAPGATLDQARLALRAVMERRGQPSADSRNVRSATADRLAAVPAGVRPVAGAFLALLTGLVTVVLLVTSANVAGMLLARGAARDREIAIRLALGAGRGRLLRQLMFEALLLFALGGGIGLVLATWLAGLAPALLPRLPVPVAIDVRPDITVLIAGYAIALLTGLAFGTAPARQAGRTDLAGVLRTTSGTASVRSGRLRRAFVTAQIGLSLVLLIAAGLFMRSLQRASRIDTGFDPRGALITGFDLSKNGYDEARGRAFLESLRNRLAAVPGVTAAGVASDLPLDLSRSGTAIHPDRGPLPDAPPSLGSDFAIVGPGYFAAAGIRVTQGRSFTAADDARATPVVIVSRTLADRVWPGLDPLGRQIRFDAPDAPLRTVIGVAADVKNSTLMEAAEPMVWLPVAQHYTPALRVVARGGPPEALAASLRAALLELDPRLAISPVQSLADYTAIGVLPQRIAAGITGALGLVALLLSTLGIYGVIAFGVARRTREIGIRMALGAHAGEVVRTIFADALRVAWPGLAAGGLAGLGLAFLLRRFLLGVAPADPAVFLLAPAALIAVIVAASSGPARRATHVPPSAALRAE